MTPAEMREADLLHDRVMEAVERPFGGHEGLKEWLHSLPLHTRMLIIKQTATLCTKISAKVVPEECGMEAAAYLGEMLREGQEVMVKAGGKVTAEEQRETAQRVAMRLASDAEFFRRRAVYTAVFTSDSLSYLEGVEEIIERTEVREKEERGPALATSGSLREALDAKSRAYLFGEMRVGKC